MPTCGTTCPTGGGLGLGWYYTNVTVDVGAKSGSAAAQDLVGKLAYNYTSLRLGVVAAF